MSCGDPHETDCSEVLNHLYEYLDRELSSAERAKFEEHFGECNPCLEKYGLEQAVKKLVKRCCGHDDVPGDLRSKVLTRLELIRSGEVKLDAEYPGGASGTVHTGPSGAAPGDSADTAAPADGSATATRTAGS